MNWVEKEKGMEVLPRFAFKKKFSSTSEREQFEVMKVDFSSVHPSYYQWCKEEILRDMKEEMLYVSEDPVDERSLETIRQTNYELPDGKTIQFGGEKINITEKMFSHNDKVPGFSGIHQMAVEAISKSDVDIKRDLF